MALRTAGSAAEPGTRGCRGEARGQGGQAGRLAKGRVGWRPRPEGPLAMWRQWVSRVPIASGEARLPCFSPRPRLSARASSSRASRRLQGSRGSPRRRSPPLPSAPSVGNARRPLQAWCRWSALGSPRAAPPRGALVQPAKPAGAPTSSAAALRTARVTESRAQLCREPAGGVRLRPALEPQERVRRPGDLWSSGAGARDLQLRPRQRASLWIPGEHHEKNEK